MAPRVRYQMNNSKDDGFAGFMLSQQVRAPVMRICDDIATEARATDGTSIAADYRAEPGPVISVGGNPRVTGEVRNDNPKAAAYEFGTGVLGEGTGGDQRTEQQRGYSPPRRHLGFIAAGYHDVIGEPG